MHSEHTRGDMRGAHRACVPRIWEQLDEDEITLEVRGRAAASVDNVGVEMYEGACRAGEALGLVAHLLRLEHPHIHVTSTSNERR